MTDLHPRFTGRCQLHRPVRPLQHAIIQIHTVPHRIPSNRPLVWHRKQRVASERRCGRLLDLVARRLGLLAADVFQNGKDRSVVRGDGFL